MRFSSAVLSPAKIIDNRPYIPVSLQDVYVLKRSNRCLEQRQGNRGSVEVVAAICNTSNTLALEVGVKYSMHDIINMTSTSLTTVFEAGIWMKWVYILKS